MFLALLVVSGNGCWVPLLVSMVTPPVVVMVLGVFPVLPPLLPVPRGFFPDVDPVFPHHRQRPLVIEDVLDLLFGLEDDERAVGLPVVLVVD